MKEKEELCDCGYASDDNGICTGCGLKKPIISKVTPEIYELLNKALSCGYHAAKDEEKGISSVGYGTSFFEKHKIRNPNQ